MASNASKSPCSLLQGSSRSPCAEGSTAPGKRGAEILLQDLQLVTRGLKKLLPEQSAQHQG